MLLSIVIDSTIKITSSELGKYDHLVVVNPEWINTFADSSKLKAINYKDIPIGMQDFLTEQMPLWTTDGSVLSEGINLYEYNGDHLLAFPTNVGVASTAINTKKPLIIMVDKPTLSMKADSFLLPLASSGNLIFTDSQKLKSELIDSSINSYILSVENIK